MILRYKLIAAMLSVLQGKKAKAMVIHGPVACGKTSIALLLQPDALYVTDMVSLAEYRSRLSLSCGGAHTVVAVTPAMWADQFPHRSSTSAPVSALIVDLDDAGKVPAVQAYAAGLDVPCIICMREINAKVTQAVDVVVRLTEKGFVVEQNRQGETFEVDLSVK